MPDSSVKSCSRWHRAKDLWHTAHCAHPEVLHVWVGTLKLSISYPFFSLCVSEQNRVEDFAIKDAVDCRSMETRVVWKSISVDRLPMFVAVFQLAAVLQMAVVHGVLTYKGFKNVLMSLFLDSSGERGPDSSGSTAGRDVPSPTARKLSFFIFCSSVKTILPRNS